MSEPVVNVHVDCTEENIPEEPMEVAEPEVTEPVEEPMIEEEPTESLPTTPVAPIPFVMPGRPFKKPIVPSHANGADVPQMPAMVHTSLFDLVKTMQAQMVEDSVTVPEPSAAAAARKVLKDFHYWPALQVKPFFGSKNMVLLHNTYTRTDVDHFSKLYNECRSVVIDLAAPEGETIVVSLAKSIPMRINDIQFQMMLNGTPLSPAHMAALSLTEAAPGYEAPKMRCEVSHEGTMVSAYHHKDTWFFSTSTCPNVNDSRFSHPTKTHGEMVDEALAAIKHTRETLGERLDKNKAYTFLLVHYQNGHIMKPADVAEEFTSEQFATLFHIGSRDRTTLEEEDIHVDKPLEDEGILYARQFETPIEALEWLKAHKDTAYGIMARTGNEGSQLIKVSTMNIIDLEQMDYGNSNPWQNFLWIYMQNKPHFHVNDYIKRFCPDLKMPVDHLGRELAPVYIIHTVMCTARDILLNLYRATTQYFPQFKRFRMDKDMDATFAPILRFHLAQLRRIQITSHTDEMVNGKTIYSYLTAHTTQKNVRMLIKFFAQSSQPMMNARAAECFAVLDSCL